jgi:transcriptional regulator CtsR
MKHFLIKEILDKMKEELLKAKSKLYELLLQLDEDLLTDVELDIMYNLSNDEQIKTLLKSKK